MDDETKRRIGGNEAAFRKVNESLRAGKGLADAAELLPFCCECGVLGCNKLIELTLPEYEAIRQSPTHFAIVQGHEILEAEDVIRRETRFWVVSTRGAAADVARAADPRS